ncbi:MAG: DJ-1/PfpI family protein [Deltaproteobacteria bacterium]|jgi:4-methyl-5(b-hydroxyethyl)-thiazole monophosphate biosynthesis|nr:DJ-1/PfpI family protein [Deltaproteobacteria bacterium]
MATAAVFLIDGIEEIEAINTIDILRRGGVQTTLVSLNPGLEVKGTNNIQIKADTLLKDTDTGGFDILVLPGGTLAYLDHKPIMDIIAEAGKKGRKLAAICVAPVVFGELGLLKGKKAVCYPGNEDRLTGAEVLQVPVVTDGNITTSRGPSTAILFGLELVRILAGQEASDKVRSGILLAA